MPTVRKSLIPGADDTARQNLLIYAPQLYDLGFKRRHIDGDALALYAHLRHEGYTCTLIDAYYQGTRPPTLAEAVESADPPVDAVLVHLWTSDAYGPTLRRTADELSTVRQTYGLTVVGFGPLAVSAAAELRAHGAIDRAIALDRHRQAAASDGREASALDAAIGRFLHTPAPLTGLTCQDVPYLRDAVVSVSASRNCRGRCTFCAYNADLGGDWVELPIDQAVADIAHVHGLTGARRFAFADSDFGGTRRACQWRANQLLRALSQHGLADKLSLSINVRSETLEPDTVRVLAAAGVKTMLVGVESFNEETLHRLYGKRQDLAHLMTIVKAADDCGITTVASYILWHPWQTMDGIRLELDAIETFGRWRIPQFMARSRLLIIPGTVIERRIQQAGLIDAGPFKRAFRFADADVAALYHMLADWFERTAVPILGRLSERQAGDLTKLAELKVAEWRWLMARSGLGKGNGAPDAALVQGSRVEA